MEVRKIAIIVAGSAIAGFLLAAILCPVPDSVVLLAIATVLTCAFAGTAFAAMKLLGRLKASQVQ